MFWCLPVCYFLECYYNKSKCNSASGLPLFPGNSFIILLGYSAFLLCCFLCYSLSKKCFVSLASGSIFSMLSSLTWRWNFLSFLVNILFHLCCWILFLYFLNLFSLVDIFGFIFSSCIICLPFCWQSFLRRFIQLFLCVFLFLNTSASPLSFFICSSNLIFHSEFVSLIIITLFVRFTPILIGCLSQKFE